MNVIDWMLFLLGSIFGFLMFSLWYLIVINNKIKKIVDKVTLSGKSSLEEGIQLGEYVYQKVDYEKEEDKKKEKIEWMKETMKKGDLSEM